ncbi:kinase-like domain-containing protein [Blakeslea trispora]|nr:kinase-like domain-containing protein [Blakeslea trispora]
MIFKMTESPRIIHETILESEHPLLERTLTRNESANKQRMVGKYYLCKTLGKGSMGKVKLAIDSETGEKVAVKIVSRKGKTQKSSEKSREIRTIREASIMLLLNHPNIAQVYEMRQISDSYYLFMEYIDGGQLLDYIISHGKLKEKQARQISRQIASALDYCHRNSIVHRDLKVENILISANGNIKIIDFGLSNVFTAKSHLSTFCGSLYFAAPELLDGRLYTGPEVDVWSFGIVIYVLVCGIVPFDDPTISGMHRKVKQGMVGYPSYLSSECRHLLKRMIVTTPTKRATLSEVIHHLWLNKGYPLPVDNHLPKRKPLTLPLDEDVIKGMRGFEFGSDDTIKTELEGLIRSEEYQRDARFLEALHASSKHQTTMPFYDPISMPAAYHPLVSIYYLVQERMEQNESGQPINQPMALSRQSSHSTDIQRRSLLDSFDPSSTSTTRHASLPRRLSHKLWMESSSNKDPPTSRFNRLLNRATSVTVKDFPSMQQARLSRAPTEHACHTLEYMRRKSAIPMPQEVKQTMENRHHADEHIRSVYIKGLFSVSTTSTKKASVIRSELIDVLTDKPHLQFRETEDRFECWMDHEVVFDIYIVKIPWLLGMRGIQFRRISGDPWRYKTICSQLLDLLQL